MAVLVGSLFVVHLLFILIQLIGNPDSGIGGLGSSLAYSLAVYVPVILVSIYALIKARRSKA